MNKDVYKKLVEIAQRETTVPYAEVAEWVNLDMSRPDDRQRMAELLDEISSSEHAAGRPLLSAIVVHGIGGEAAGMPGGGFFVLAKRLKLQSQREDKVTFFAKELRRVHKYWNAH
jgi:hypothetical protein